MVQSNRVVFTAEDHSYTNSKGERYISTTTLIKKFEEHKDWKAIAEKCVVNPRSPYFGRQVSDVLAQWDRAGAEARPRGTIFHAKKENAILDGTEVVKVGEKVFQPMNLEASSAPIIDFAKLPDKVYPEMTLWNHRYKIAGQADKVIIDGDFFDILDYKTSKKIDKESYWDRKKGYRKMKYPLNHLMDCNFYHYALQLSVYAYMLEMLSGKKCRHLTLLHHPTIYDENGVASVQEEAIPYELPYLRNEVLMMLNLWGGYAPADYVPKVAEVLVDKEGSEILSLDDLETTTESTE